MQFKKHSETKVTVTDANGKEHNFTKQLDIPYNRYMAAKPYLLQDELAISFESLHLFINKLKQIATNDTATATATKQALSDAIRALEVKVNCAEDMVTIKMFLAAIVWTLDNEDLTEFDPMLQAEKVKLMNSSTKAQSFFLRSPLPFENLKSMGAIDTLLAFQQMSQMVQALTDIQQTPMTY